MPRGKRKTNEDAPKFEELVSPDGERKETPLNASRDVVLRFQGYLPAEQAKLSAPSGGETDSGSSALAGSEKTVSTPTPTGGK